MSTPALPAPNGENAPEVKWDDDYTFAFTKDHQAKYADAIPPREVKERKARGRKGADELFNIVSSKMARDIKRKQDWISNASFNIWNAKDMERHGGVQRYWGQLEDYDHDGMPIEYVVRRGGSDGPVVAVNGYTTSKSDFPWRYDYYEAYPTEEKRKEKSFGDFIHDKYGPTYKPDHMTVESYKLDPESDSRTRWIKQHGGYTYPVPKDITPYQAISTIVHGIIGDIILNNYAKGDEEMAKEIRKKIMKASGKGPGFASVLCSLVYDTVITTPIHDLLRTKGLMPKYIELFVETKRRTKPEFEFKAENPEHADMFNKWLAAKKKYKQAAKKLAKQYVSDENRAKFKADITARIKASLDRLSA